MAGNPTKYRPEFATQARKLAKAGLTDQEMADFFDIDRSTFYEWLAVHARFAACVQLGKEAPNKRVERSLYQRACGYEYDAVKIGFHKGQPVIAHYREHVPPDPGAAKQWLSNRCPDEWRERVEHNLSPDDPLAEFLRSINGRVLQPTPMIEHKPNILSPGDSEES